MPSIPLISRIRPLSILGLPAEMVPHIHFPCCRLPFRSKKIYRGCGRGAVGGGGDEKLFAPRYERGAVGAFFIVAISPRVVSLLHLIPSARVLGPSSASRGSPLLAAKSPCTIRSRVDRRSTPAADIATAVGGCAPSTTSCLLATPNVDLPHNQSIYRC
jgi:hypothetical protein